MDLRARHYLVATASTPERGRLRQAIEDAVEGALAPTRRIASTAGLIHPIVIITLPR